MSDSERKKLLGEMEAEFRRTETGLAVAQVEYEKAYAALWAYMNDHTDGARGTLAFSPGVTMH
ncbi:MAG: hypothetical protein ABW278_08125 [Steroidobacteraceae bacterium]